jgi:hypothetical protein
MTELTGMAANIKKRCDEARAAGLICKHCGEAIRLTMHGSYHIVSFMTLCRDRNTYVEIEEKTCLYCKEPINWSEIFGWYHGDMRGGWNTSCVDDEHRATFTEED